FTREGAGQARSLPPGVMQREHVNDYINVLDAAARGKLPDRVNERSDPPFDLVRELVEAGLLTAIDASSHDGFEYLDPRITFAGREYLRKNAPSVSSSSRRVGERLERLRDMMIAVATGGPRIQESNDAYRALYSEVD